jgi:two-component system response regulator YesN
MNPRISRSVESIYRILDKGISLKKAAQLANLSYGYFGELFKKETGKCFREYLREKRIERARFLLDNTGKEIKEIYLSVGYKDIQNFYHDFKKRTGLTPRKYRRKTGS